MYDVTMTSLCERAHENWEMAVLCVKYGQYDFYVKNHKNMRFSWDFL